MERTSGLPTSANGASSFHLGWRGVDGPWAGAAVEFQLRDWPRTDRLVFWALQVSFVESSTGRVTGGGHLGLQWHPQYPGRTAACWGGYHVGGGELSGGPLAFPSALGNPNTCNFSFSPGVRYRFVIEPHPDGWAGRIQTHTGSTTLRVLFGGGDAITAPMMWTECFAACDDPSISAAWFRPQTMAFDGSIRDIDRVAVNYQTVADGGCSTTNSRLVRDPSGVVGIEQATNVARVTAQGAELALSAPG